jgi:hypothetical protein
MRHSVRKMVFLAGIAAFFSLAGCTSNETIALNGAGGGTAHVRFEIHKLFADYFKGDSGVVFDTAKVKKGIEKRPGFRVSKISSPRPESLEMDLAFTDLRTLFSDDPTDDDGIVRITEKDGKTTIALHLDRKSAKKMGALFGDVSNPAFREMSPREQKARTEAEYLEAIEFAVGKEGPPLMKRSSLKITVAADGQLVSQTGGKIENGAAVFDVPLLRMLMLEKPLDYSITFVPNKKAPPKKPAKAR